MYIVHKKTEPISHITSMYLLLQRLGFQCHQRTSVETYAGTIH